MAGETKTLLRDTMNPLVRDMRDPRASPTTKRALELERELRKGVMKPFTEVIRADINDVQPLCQKPITFTREVLTACTYPLLLEDAFIPSDVKLRVDRILDECGGRSVGSYTYSEGIDLIREHVADFIGRRDGCPSRPEDVVLSSGGIDALRAVLNVINSSSLECRIGVLVPVPRDPDVSALLEELGIVQIDYYLEEDDGWSINPEDLCVALEASRRYCSPQAILVINPGNPTGAVLSPHNMESVVRFAAHKRLVLLADEAYQLHALAQGSPFQSFKKMIAQMGPPFDRIELISFMAGATRLIGQNCLYWGYNEFLNIGEDVCKVFKKSICVKMCPGVLGQIALDCMITPPQPLDSSYESFIQEWSEAMVSYHERASTMTKALNEIEGIECSRHTASECVFPKILIPQKAQEEAKKEGLSPDIFYALNLLEETGICSQPGKLFGQLPGTYHLRLTLQPMKEKNERMLDMIRQFHSFFLLKYS